HPRGVLFPLRVTARYLDRSGAGCEMIPVATFGHPDGVAECAVLGAARHVIPALVLDDACVEDTGDAACFWEVFTTEDGAAGMALQGRRVEGEFGVHWMAEI